MGPLRVKLWGTRGLISSPRRETAVHGGNTSSVQILYKNHLILVDTGFGCANLGDELIGRILGQGEALHVHIFYTHFHWDHIQGLPFFKPIYFPSTKIDIHSPERTARTIDSLNILFDGSYSPFESLLTMQAQVALHQLEGGHDLDGLRIDVLEVDHGTKLSGDACYAYRFTTEDGASVCVVTDHEARGNQKNRDVVEFAKGADILIHDAQFTEAEYANHKGWGHSSMTRALDNAVKAEAGLTLLTHHHPSRNDKQLFALHRELLLKPKYRAVRFEFAREDVVYEAARVRALPKAG